jgi:hypothetical protein
MSRDEVSSEVAAFLRAHVESYEELEALLMLHRNRARVWSPRAIATTIGASESDVLSALDALVRRGLVLRVAAPERTEYKFIADGVASDLVARLAEAYTNDPIGVMRLMSANAIARVRSDLHAFSDAFLIGRRKRDG